MAIFLRPSSREANLAEVLRLHQENTVDDANASLHQTVDSTLVALRIDKQHLRWTDGDYWCVPNLSFELVLTWTLYHSPSRNISNTIQWSQILLTRPRRSHRRFLTDDEVEALGDNLRFFKDNPRFWPPADGDDSEQVSVFEVDFELVWILAWQNVENEESADGSIPLLQRVNSVVVDKRVVRRFVRDSDGAIPLVDVTKSVLENYQELCPRAYAAVKSDDVCCVIDEDFENGDQGIVWQGRKIWSATSYDSSFAGNLGKAVLDLPPVDLRHSVLWYNHLVTTKRSSSAVGDVPFEDLKTEEDTQPPLLRSVMMVHLPSCQIVDLRIELMGIGARVKIFCDGFARVGRFQFFEGVSLERDTDQGDRALLQRRAEYRSLRGKIVEDEFFSTEESARLEHQRILQWTEFRIVARKRCLRQVWTPESHLSFPLLYRRLVMDLLLCHQRAETNFSSLPTDIVLYEILPFVEGLGVYYGYSDELKWFYRFEEIPTVITDWGDGGFLKVIERIRTWSTILSAEQWANPSLQTLDEWIGNGICVLKPVHSMSCSQCRDLLGHLGPEFLQCLLKLLVSLAHCPIQTKLHVHLRPIFYSSVLACTEHLLKTHFQRGKDEFRQVLARLESPMKELLNWMENAQNSRCMKDQKVLNSLVCLLDAFVLKSASCTLFRDADITRFIVEVVTRRLHWREIGDACSFTSDGCRLIARILESYVVSPCSDSLRQVVIDATRYVVRVKDRHSLLSSVLPRIYMDVPDLRLAMLDGLKDDLYGQLNGGGLWSQFWQFFLENCQDLDPQTDLEKLVVDQMFVNYLGNSESITGVELGTACSSLNSWLASEPNLSLEVVGSRMFQWIEAVLPRVFGTELLESILDLLRSTFQLSQPSSFEFDLDKLFRCLADPRCCWPVRLQETVTVFIKGKRRDGDLKEDKLLFWEKLGSARDSVNSLQASAPFVQWPGRREFLKMYRQLAEAEPETRDAWSISAIRAVRSDLELENPSISTEDVASVFDVLLRARGVDGLPLVSCNLHPPSCTVALLTSFALEEELTRFAKFVLEKFSNVVVGRLLPEFEVRRLLLRVALFCPQQFSGTPQSDLHAAVLDLLLKRSCEIRHDLISTLQMRGLPVDKYCLCLRGRMLRTAIRAFESRAFPWKDVVSLLVEGLSSTSEHVRASFSPILMCFGEDPSRLSDVAAALAGSLLSPEEQFFLLSKLFPLLDDSQWAMSTGLAGFIDEFLRVLGEYFAADSEVVSTQKTVLTFVSKVQLRGKQLPDFEIDGIAAIDFLKILIPKKDAEKVLDALHYVPKEINDLNWYLKTHLPALLKIIAFGSKSLIVYIAELVHSTIKPESWDFDIPERTKNVTKALVQRFEEIDSGEWTLAEREIMNGLRSIAGDEFIRPQRKRRGRISRRTYDDFSTERWNHLPPATSKTPVFEFQDVSVPTFESEPSSRDEGTNRFEPLSYLNLDFGFPDVAVDEAESEGESEPPVEENLFDVPASAGSVLPDPSFEPTPLSSSFVFDFGDSLDLTKNPFDIASPSESLTEPAFELGLPHSEPFDFDACSFTEDDAILGRE